jgi:DNA-binding PadR family transcriptional regulator
LLQPTTVAVVSSRVRAPRGLAEHVCLVLVAQGVEHGWAIGTLLAPGGELGRIWALSRPLTYRAIDGLVAGGFVARKGPAAGRGGSRTVLRPTAAGRRAAATWLDEPVEHLRDVRTELLLKLALRARAGLERHALIEAQEEALRPAIDALTRGRTDADDVVALWRRESALAVRRFLRAAASSR